MHSGDEIITAEECRRMMREAEGVERQIIEDMVARVQAAIRRSLKQGLTRTSVSIPNFFYGCPSFDQREVGEGVRAVFRGAGYHIRDSRDPHTFLVSWDLDPPPASAAVAQPSAAAVAAQATAAVSAPISVTAPSFSSSPVTGSAPSLEDTRNGSQHKTVRLA